MALSARQNLLARSYLAIAAKLGAWSKDSSQDGAHYIDASLNGAKDKGIACHNCVFWKASGGCVIVKGQIGREAICKLNIIDPERIKQPPVVTLRGRGRISGSIG